ncbi:MAG: aldo/keto reductase [Alphaproteobacteria bacterium]|nr:aldo/keto reductase [Alphaproteobacteria bacterium]
MIYIDLENRKIPALGFGTWQLKGEACTHSVLKALEIGYRHIDTAQIYENEEHVGAALVKSGIKRDDIFLTTKVWMSNLGEKLFHKSVEESLVKLKTDHVDLLLIHWPVTDIPFAEQMKSLRMVQESGLAHMIGLSNFTVPQMREVVEDLGIRVLNNQVEYHPFLSQKPVLDYVRGHDMFLTAYSPLARGKVREDVVLREIADKHGKNPGQIALRWLLQQDRVAAIPKAASEEHMRGNFEIFDFVLDADEMQRISLLTRTASRLINPDWAPHWDQVAA